MFRIRNTGSHWDRTCIMVSFFYSESQRIHHVPRLQRCLFLSDYVHQSVNCQLRLFSVKLLKTTDLFLFYRPLLKNKTRTFLLSLHFV